MNQTNTTVSNEEIMEFLNKFYNEFIGLKNELNSFKNQTDSRFTNIENKLSNHSEKFEIINTKLNYQAAIMERHENTLQEILKDRKELKLGLTKSLFTVTGVLSGAIAIVVSFVTGKAITYSIK